MKFYVVLALLLSSFSSYTQNLGREGGGGQSVYIGENAYLRDLIEKNNCVWASSKRVLKKASYFQNILDMTEALNPAFKLRLEEEFKNLKFCFTNKRLPILQYNNSDDLHIFANQEYDQPAINDGGVVFIANKIFKDMSLEHKGFLVLHESLHGLFSKEEKRSEREPRLREFVLNMGEQLKELFQDKDDETFNIVVRSARFTQLEEAVLSDIEEFVKLWSQDLGLYERVIALNKVKQASSIFSPYLLELLEKTVKERNEELEKIKSTVHGGVTVENLRSLNQGLKDIKELSLKGANDKFYNDTQASLNANVMSVLNNLHVKDQNLLKSLFAAVGIKNELSKTTSFSSLNMIKNFDEVFGLYSSVRLLATAIDGLPLILYGRYVKASAHCRYRNRCPFHIWVVNQVVADARKYTGLKYGVLSDKDDVELRSYYLDAFMNDSHLNSKVTKFLEDDIAHIKANGLSEFGMNVIHTKYRLAGYKKEGMIGTVLNKKQQAREIKLREELISIIK